MSSLWPNTTVTIHETNQSINMSWNLTTHESMGWEGILENTLRKSTNCGHTSLTDDTSAGLKCSATVRVCSTLAASRRLFLAGSGFSSALACWYVSFPSAIYIKNNNKHNLHLNKLHFELFFGDEEGDHRLTNTVWTIPGCDEESTIFLIFIN